MSNPDLKAQNYTEYFSRHLIGLCWYEAPVNKNGEFTLKPDYRCASGFLLQIKNTFCLITAGHVLTEYNKRAKKGLKGQCHRLLDIWSPRSTCKEPIPFNFADATSFVFDSPDKGLDFAVIILPDTILQMFSQTIVPFTDERWMYQKNVKFDFFAMLGIPSIDATQNTKSNGTRNTITTFPNSRVILVEACLNPPSDSQKTEFPQFVGKFIPMKKFQI